jgi:hypothetical protein
MVPTTKATDIEETEGQRKRESWKMVYTILKQKEA